MPGARPASRHAHGSARQAAPHPARSAPRATPLTARWDLGQGTQPLPGTQAWRCFCARLFISTARPGPSWGPRLGHRPTCAPAATSGPPSQLPRPRRSFAPLSSSLPASSAVASFQGTLCRCPHLALPPAHACWQDSDLGGTGPHPRTLCKQRLTAWQAGAHPPEQLPLPLASLPGPPTPGLCPRQGPLQVPRERQGWLGDAYCSGCPRPIAAVALTWLAVSRA